MRLFFRYDLETDVNNVMKKKKLKYGMPVLGQLPSNPKSNLISNPNPKPNRGHIFSGAIDRIPLCLKKVAI